MITETYLMNMDMRIMQERMKQDPVYVEMFKTAGMVSRRTAARATRSRSS